MKKVDKVILTIFSIIILIEGIILNLLIVEWIDTRSAHEFIREITSDPLNKGTLLIAVICMLLAIKAIFWTKTEPSTEQKRGRDVLMQNDNGRLMISISTIESLVNSVVGQFNSVRDINTSILVDEQNNVSVLVNLVVMKDVIIKDLTLTIQNKIKEAIKKTSDLEVKEVNVRIKNIVSNPEAQNNE